MNALRRLTGTADVPQGLAQWIAAHDGKACVAALTAAGIAAAPVLDGEGLLDHRNELWGDALLRADNGEFVKGFPFRLGEAPLRVRRDAPCVGADTAEVLARVGGYSPDEIAALVRAGAVEVAQ